MMNDNLLDGIGPKHLRPRRPELAWLTEESNQFVFVRKSDIVKIACIAQCASHLTLRGSSRSSPKTLDP